MDEHGRRRQDLRPTDPDLRPVGGVSLDLYARISRELRWRSAGAATPALLVVESVVSRSRRETEIAQLASIGLTSKEIADRCSSRSPP